MSPLDALDELDRLGHHHARRYRELYAIDPVTWGEYLISLAAVYDPSPDFEALEAARLAYEAMPEAERRRCCGQ
jgi:hypothetical protein